MRQLDRARDAGAEANAVISSVDVVVHRLRNGDDAYPFVMQSLAVTQGVVSPDRDQHVDSDVLEVFEDVFGDVVDLFVVAGEVRRHAPAR